jgi:hypothetical protein
MGSPRHFQAAENGGDPGSQVPGSTAGSPIRANFFLKPGTREPWNLTQDAFSASCSKRPLEGALPASRHLVEALVIDAADYQAADQSASNSPP